MRVGCIADFVENDGEPILMMRFNGVISGYHCLLYGSFIMCCEFVGNICFRVNILVLEASEFW